MQLGFLKGEEMMFTISEYIKPINKRVRCNKMKMK